MNLLSGQSKWYMDNLDKFFIEIPDFVLFDALYMFNDCTCLKVFKGCKKLYAVKLYAKKQIDSMAHIIDEGSVDIKRAVNGANRNTIPEHIQQLIEEDEPIKGESTQEKVQRLIETFTKEALRKLKSDGFSIRLHMLLIGDLYDQFKRSILENRAILCDETLLVNHVDLQGNTILHLACENEDHHYSVVFLLEHGANPFTLNNHHKSPKDLLDPSLCDEFDKFAMKAAYTV